MWAPRYWTSRYWARHYWAPNGGPFATAIESVPRWVALPRATVWTFWERPGTQ